MVPMLPPPPHNSNNGYVDDLLVLFHLDTNGWNHVLALFIKDLKFSSLVSQIVQFTELCPIMASSLEEVKG